MSVLPRVTKVTRERISREFDELGPEVCMSKIEADLRQHNPELLDMASRWAGETPGLMTAFGMFYRLLAAEARAPLSVSDLNPLPRVSPEVRDSIVERIDRTGGETFTREAVDNLASSRTRTPTDGTRLCFAASRLWSDDAGLRPSA